MLVRDYGFLKHRYRELLLPTIDYVVRYVGDEVTFTLTYEGKLINPINDEDVKVFEGINGTLEYNQVLGFNRTFINVPV